MEVGGEKSILVFASPYILFFSINFLLKKVLVHPSILSLPEVTCGFFSLPLVLDNWNRVQDIPFNMQSGLLQKPQDSNHGVV